MIELTLTMLEPGCFSRCGIAARVMAKVPFKFVETSLSKYSSVVSVRSMAVGFTPAQLKTKSNLPKWETVFSTKAVQAVASATLESSV